MIPCVILKYAEGLMQKNLYIFIGISWGWLTNTRHFLKVRKPGSNCKTCKNRKKLRLLWLSVMGGFCVTEHTGDLDMNQSILEPMFVVQAKIFQNWQISRCLLQLFNVQKVCRDEVPAALRSVKIGFMSFFNHFKTVAFLLVLQQIQFFSFY